MVFLDVALPWNCNVLSVKALEFQVWFGMKTFLWQTFSIKDIHAYLWFLMVLSFFGGKGIGLIRLKISLWGCWQVERETDKRDWLHDGFSKDVPGGKNYSVNHFKYNTHIRYSSYLTKLCLVFILAKFALVLIPDIQFSISGTWCVVFTLKMSHLFWATHSCSTRFSISVFPNTLSSTLSYNSTYPYISGILSF